MYAWLSVYAHACWGMWDVCFCVGACVHTVYWGACVCVCALGGALGLSNPLPRVTHAPSCQQVAPEHHALGSGEGARNQPSPS